MRLSLTTDQGVVVKTWERVEDFDLSKPIAQAVVIGEIKEAIERGYQMEKAAK